MEQSGTSSDNPVLVEVTRGQFVESRHRGCAVVVDTAGRMIEHWGDPHQLIVARSALKLIYAIPLVTSGAADALGCTPIELTLACSSHLGGRFHSEPIRAWLQRIKLDESALQCGVHTPFGRQVQEGLIRHGKKPTPIMNNNSGKHAGFLSAAVFKREPLADYLHRDHPVQLRIRDVVEQLCQVRLDGLPQMSERCGAPIHAIPIFAVAFAMARFAAGSSIQGQIGRASSALMQAITAYPRYLVGEGRLSTLIIEATAGRIIVKGGSEGVFAGFDRQREYGFAIKIDDGGSRAADVAILALLVSYGWLEEHEIHALRDRMEPPVFDAHDRDIGVVRWCANHGKPCPLLSTSEERNVGGFA
jgi:L-asparaginase II